MGKVVFSKKLKSCLAINKAGILFVLPLFLLGCATNPKDGEPANKGQYDQLIGGSEEPSVGDAEKSKLDIAKSAEEARTRAEQARQAGDNDRAIFYYVKALEFDDKDIPSLLAVAELHANAGRHPVAKLAYEMAVAREGENVDALEGLGVSELKLGDYQNAKTHLEQALTIDANRLRAINARAVVADIERDFETSREYYGRGLALAPNSAVILNNFGYSRYLAGDWEKAEQLYIKLLNRYPAHYNGNLNYGLLQTRQRRLKDALTTFEKVLPRAVAYNEMGFILMLDGYYGDAETLFERAISESPSYFVKAAENLEHVRALRVRKNPIHDAQAAAVVPIDQLPTGSPTSLGLSSDPEKQPLDAALAAESDTGIRPESEGQAQSALPLERRQLLDSP